MIVRVNIPVISWTANLSQMCGRLSKDLYLGDLGEITPDVYKNFVDSGLVHALSASGLHVAIVMMLVFMGVRAVTWAVPTVLLWLPFRK